MVKFVGQDGYGTTTTPVNEVGWNEGPLGVNYLPAPGLTEVEKKLEYMFIPICTLVFAYVLQNHSQCFHLVIQNGDVQRT